MFRAVWMLCRDESGVTTVEYALLLGLVAMASIVAWQLLATDTHGSVQSSVVHIGNAMSDR